MKKTFWGDYNEINYPTLKNNTSCDHLIIGGGVAGLFTAYFLLESGQKNIVLVEKYTIGSGSTGHSAGMLVREPEQATWKELVKRYGAKEIVKYTEAERVALECVKSIVKKHKIECDLQEDPLLLLSNTSDGSNTILSDFTTRKKIGLKSTLLEKNVAQKIFNIQGIRLAQSVENNLSVNPLLFAKGLAKVLKNKGVKIYEHSQFISVDKNTATINDKKVIFKSLVECTGTHSREKSISVYLTTIAVTNKLNKKTITKLRANDRDMFIDSQKRSFHYGKFTKDNRMLIGYGDVLKKDEPKDDPLHIPHIKNIEHFIEKSFPKDKIKINYAWSARYALTKSLLPIVQINKNKFYINGAGTQVDSIVCARYISDKIVSKKNELDKLFKKD